MAQSSKEYKREWNRRNPDKVRASKIACWERKAQKFYGSRYIPSDDPDKMSLQARALYNEYYRERRIVYPDENKTNVMRYWKRKAGKSV